MQKGFAHSILIAVFVLAIIAAAGIYFFIFKNQPNDKLVPPTLTNSKTQPWQTFKSEEVPFTFEYPQGWRVENTAFNGDYQGIVLKGPEGEINMDWGTGLEGHVVRI